MIHLCLTNLQLQKLTKHLGPIPFFLAGPLRQYATSAMPLHTRVSITYDHIGSDVADRDALLWAGLWRLSIDSDLPTTFCFDSIVAGHFADGTYGTAKPSQQHRLLRGVFQLACSLGLSRLVDLDAAQRAITSVRECGLARKRTPLQRLQGELV